MNTQTLINALESLPTENYEFSAVRFDGGPDETDSVDSMGSCCDSPNQSSEGSLSPTPNESSSCDDEYFVFPKHQDNADSELKLQRKMECKVKRNERERRRVRRLADGFKKLREVVPGNYKKLSKLDTLRRALDYMASLAEIVDTQSTGRYDHSLNGMAFKQERNQLSHDYTSCSPPSYHPNTISYQPSPPEWSSPAIFEQKHVPTFTPYSAQHHPYYISQRPSMMMPYQQQYAA